MKQHTISSILFAASIAAVGCTGANGTDGTNGTNGANGSNGLDSIVQSSAEPAGANCPTGGTKLEIGQDTDGDGALTGAEISQTVYVCNGTDGATGSQSLLAITDEPAGANCAAGGKKIDYGIDDDGNGTLDAGEIDGTAYACNGSDGLESLIATTYEVPGLNCDYGGTKVTSGIDDDGNGTLEASEVDATSYVCDAVVRATLYLSQDNNANGLFRLDIQTGQATPVGASGVTSSTVGLTYDPSAGVLLGSLPFSLATIATDGSGATNLGGVAAEALAYDYVNNVLYGAINGQFFTMNKATGAKVADLAAPGADVEGLAFRADTGTIYGTANGNTQLFAYSIANNTWAQVGALGVDLRLGGLTYAPWTRTLYATGGSNGNLYRINPATAQATLVGPTGLGNANGGLEYVPAAYP